MLITISFILLQIISIAQNKALKPFINLPTEIGITQEFTGKVEYVIKNNGIFYFTLNDPINGLIDLHLNIENCNDRSDEFRINPIYSDGRIERMINDELMTDKIYLKVLAKSSLGRFCFADKNIIAKIWRPVRISLDLTKQTSLLNLNQINKYLSINNLESRWEQIYNFEFKNDLSSVIRDIDSNISKNIQNLQIIFDQIKLLKKDPFETSKEFDNRLNQYFKSYRYFEHEKINPLLFKINQMNNIFERRNKISNPFEINIENYDADYSKWVIFYKDSITSKTEKIYLHLLPERAKQLWIHRNMLNVYILKNINDRKYDFIEINIPAYENSNSFSVLLSRDTNKVLFSNNSEIPIDPPIDQIIEIKTDLPTSTKIEKIEEKISAEDKVHIRVEIEAEFPGGINKWTEFITKEISSKKNREALQEDGKSGTVIIFFIVDEYGNPSEIRALNCSEAGVANCLGPHTKLAEVAISAIKNGPKWKPAVLNGRNVKAYRRQPVTFRLAEK